MAELTHYRQAVISLLEQLNHYDQSSSQDGVESQLICDRDHDHYLLVDVGWEQNTFVYGTIIHVDIKDEKIWIQRNNTEINLAERLVEMGVPKLDIVLGLHSPFLRKLSGYAVN